MQTPQESQEKNQVQLGTIEAELIELKLRISKLNSKLNTETVLNESGIKELTYELLNHSKSQQKLIEQISSSQQSSTSGFIKTPQGENQSFSALLESIADLKESINKIQTELVNLRQPTWKCVRVIKENGFTSQIVFSPDGQILASNGKIWEIATGRSYSWGGGDVITFDFDGAWLVGLSYNYVAIFDIRNETDLPILLLTSSNEDIEDGNAEYSGSIIFLDEVSFIVPLIIPKDDHKEFYIEKFRLPDSRAICQIKTFASASLKSEGTLPISFNTKVTSIALSPEGENIAIQNIDGSMNISTIKGNFLSQCCEDVITQSSNESQDLKNHRDHIELLDDFDEDREQNQLSRMIYRELEFRKELKNSIAFSPDGTILAGGGKDGKIRLWDTKTYKLILSIQAHSDIVSCLTFSPSDQTLVSGSLDGTIKFWNLKIDKHDYALDHSYSLIDYSSKISALAFHPTGQTLASCSFNFAGSNIKIWQLFSS